MALWRVQKHRFINVNLYSVYCIQRHCSYFVTTQKKTQHHILRFSKGEFRFSHVPCDVSTRPEVPGSEMKFTFGAWLPWLPLLTCSATVLRGSSNRSTLQTEDERGTWLFQEVRINGLQIGLQLVTYC